MTNQSMQAFTFKRYGKSPDVGLATTARPAALKANEILVQVHAAALNLSLIHISEPTRPY